MWTLILLEILFKILFKIILRIIIPNVIQGPILRNFKIVFPMVEKIKIHFKVLQKILCQILFKVLVSSSFPPSSRPLPALPEGERGDTGAGWSCATLTIKNTREGSSLMTQFVALSFREFKSSHYNCHYR